MGDASVGQSRERDPVTHQIEEDIRGHLGTLEERVRSTSQAMSHDVATVRDMAEALAEYLDEENATAARELVARLDVLSGQLTLSTVPLEQASLSLRKSIEKLIALLRESELEVRNYATLNSVALMLTRETNVDRLLENIMDTILEVAIGERGFLILIGEDGHLEFPVARHIDRVEIEDPAFESSRSIIESVIEKREAICLTSAMEDATFSAAASVQRLGLRSVVCVPLVSDERLVGAIYMDNSLVSGVFTEKDVALLNALGRQIAAGIEKALLFRKLERREEELARQIRGKYHFDEIVGSAPSLVNVLKLTAEVADTDATVLIQGESGTGKELIARAIHLNSRRAQKPFVALNCAAIPEHLLESELFGHVRGAFTGALDSKPGKFELADGGTLFMDEIGDMSMSLQMKILRVVQEREVERLGSNRPVRVDVRILAATNRDLRAMVREGKFREDLFHRLNVINIVLPPLRERPEDILPLAESFLAPQARELGREITGFSPGAIRCLTGYSFPGNVRELENMIKRAAILTRGSVVTEEHLPDYVRGAESASAAITPVTSQDLLEAKRRAREEAYERVERPFLEQALRRAGGQVSRAAAETGMNRVQFHGLLKKYGLDARKYRERRGSGAREARPETDPAGAAQR
jgi:transcriptional regulator with GAF, ATPase, and Fis domain